MADPRFLRAVRDLLSLMEIDGYPISPDDEHVGDEMKMVLNSTEYRKVRTLMNRRIEKDKS